MKFIKHYEKGYTTVSNEVLRDKNLSNAAKGLFVFLWSCSDEFHITVDGLQAICKDGRDAIRAQLKALEEAGYLQMSQEKENGRFSTSRYDMRDSKDTPFNTAPSSSTPSSGFPTSETNTDKEILIEEILNKETTPAISSSSHSSTKKIKTKREEERGRERKRYFQIPIYDEVEMYVRERGYEMDPYDFFTFYEQKGWRANGRPMKDWRKCCDAWERHREDREDREDERYLWQEKADELIDMAIENEFDFVGAMERAKYRDTEAADDWRDD